MKSIDNLREYALTAPSICSTTRAILVGYIDNIEREAADMVPMPVDADGVPIRVGDTVTCGRSVWEVTGLRLTGAAWGVCCTIFNDHGGSGTNVYPPCDLRHHHAPTVEDVLEEFVARWMETHHDDLPSLKAEYAAKLRLKEG